MNYIAQPKQELFHYAKAEEVLYGGAAGGGKSEAIMWDATHRALKYQGVRIGVFRRTYPELEKSLIFNFLKKVPQDLYTYSKKEHRATFKDGHSVIDYNHCQYDSDVFKFQSVEYDFLYFDELTHFTEFIYQYLLSRLRTTTANIVPQVKSGSNPGNIGHLWVKKRFIDGVEPYKMIQREIDTDGYIEHYTTQFIPATLYDNTFLMEKDPSYEKRLRRLPDDEKRALLDGDWDVFKGQFFKEWDDNKHVIEPFEIPRNWKRFMAMDWGYSNPTCVLWMCISPKDELYVYRELYTTETNIPELARLMREMSVYNDDNISPEKIDYTVADPSIWSITQFERGESIAMRLAEEGIICVKADNSRLSGWSAVHDVLMFDKEDKNSRPQLQVFSHCRNLIRTLPAQIYDERRPEDLDTTNEDHAVDALRYGIMSNPRVTKSRKMHIVTPNTFNALLAKIQKSKKREGAYIGR